MRVTVYALHTSAHLKKGATLRRRSSERRASEVSDSPHVHRGGGPDDLQLAPRRRQMSQIGVFTQRLHSYWLLRLALGKAREEETSRYVFGNGGIFVLCVRVSRVFVL